jgi:cytochrome c oxidase subunit 2
MTPPGWLSALWPGADQAARIGHLFWLFTGISVLVYVAVVLALAWALWRPRGNDPAREGDTRRRMRLSVGAGAGVTVGLLLVLLLASIRTDRALAARPSGQPLTIRVTAHQWWWQIEYPSPQPSEHFATANELHLPVGEPVRILLAATDVIHSFWVPSLHGKKDAIPGYASEIWITPTTTGTFRGQCAEFCGPQHARMGLLVLVESREQFDAWAARQRQPAPEPATPELARGRDVFLGTQCVMCHTVRGTPSGSRVGPDLTHVGSRQTLGAVQVPTTRDALVRWIADPQGVKPGNRMPPSVLPPADLQALSAWLESLR